MWREAVFKKLSKTGLKLKPNKCEFLKSEITYLGHITSNQGIATDPKKIKAIQMWPQPETVTQAQKFTGLTNYYHKFIHNYAKVPKPTFISVSIQCTMIKVLHLKKGGGSSFTVTKLPSSLKPKG